MTPPKIAPRATRSLVLHRALADVMLLRMREKRLQRSEVAPSAGISRQYLQRLLSAKSEISLFVVTELSRALEFSNEMELLSQLFERRQRLLDELHSEEH